MHGEKVSGGYEAGFVFTEQHRDMVLAAMRARDWFKRRYSKYQERVVDDRQGKVRAKAVRSTGFMGNKGWRLVVPTQGELNAVYQTPTYALLPLYKVGDRVRTLVPLWGWGNAEPSPAGTMGTVTSINAGELGVRWDDDGKEWKCAPWWFEVVA